MTIQCYPSLLNYVNATIHPLAPKSGRFLELFLHSCLRADGENFELLKPALFELMLKYPADPERLKREEEDGKAGVSQT